MHLASRYLETLRTLAAPRRAVPVALVVGAMLWAQQRAAPLVAGFGYLAPAVAMALAFVLVAPFAWRALFPPGQRPTALRLLAYAVLAAAQERAEALEREAERARLLAMRAHLDPHFLFNTLNALAEWTREDPAVAEQGLLRLSALLREVLKGIEAPAWPADRELKLRRDLLELHQLRDPAWFTLDGQVPETVPVEVPPLLLLPLAENAVKHGPAKGHRGPITVRVAIEVDRLRFALSNHGPFAGRRPGGEGLATLERRLDLAYGSGGRLVVDGDAATTRVTVEAPLHPLETA